MYHETKQITHMRIGAVCGRRITDVRHMVWPARIVFVCV